MFTLYFVIIEINIVVSLLCYF